MDPATIAAGVTALGSILGSKKSGGGPSSATSFAATEAVFDNSGWAVTFGDSSGIDQKNASGGRTGAGSGNDSYLPWAVLIVGAVIALKLIKRMG